MKLIIGGIGFIASMLGIYVFISGNQSISDLQENTYIEASKHLKDVDNLALIEYIDNLPNELKNIEKKLDKEVKLNPDEFHISNNINDNIYDSIDKVLVFRKSEFIKKVWLQLAKSYKNEYFGNKNSSEFIEDYISKENRLYIDSTNPKEVDFARERRIFYKLSEMIEEFVKNISDKNQKIDYQDWKDRWEKSIDMKELKLSVKDDEFLYGK